MGRLDLQEIRAKLQLHRAELQREYGVVEIGVFGSYARGEATAESDVDILVEFGKPIGFFKYLELEECLGEWLGTKVDLVTRAALKPHIGERILEEVSML
jgi:predicted nucleotidyltransferase